MRRWVFVVLVLAVVGALVSAGAVRVEVDVDNADLRLKPGMFVRTTKPG